MSDSAISVSSNTTSKNSTQQNRNNQGYENNSSSLKTIQTNWNQPSKTVRTLWNQPPKTRSNSPPKTARTLRKSTPRTLRKSASGTLRKSTPRTLRKSTPGTPKRTLRRSMNNSLASNLQQLETKMFGSTLPFDVVENRKYYSDKNLLDKYNLHLFKKLKKAEEELFDYDKLISKNNNLRGGYFFGRTKKFTPVKNWKDYIKTIKTSRFRKLKNFSNRIKKNKEKIKVSNKDLNEDLNEALNEAFKNWISKFTKTMEILNTQEKFNIDELIISVNSNNSNNTFKELEGETRNNQQEPNSIIREVYPFPQYQKLVKVKVKVKVDYNNIPLYGMQSPFDDLESSSKTEACQLMSYLMFEKGIKIFISLQENKYEQKIWETLKNLHPVYKKDSEVKYIEFIVNDYCPMSLDIAQQLLTLLTKNLENNQKYVSTVIHCGAGCGRTGSVMMLLRLFIEAKKKKKEVNIFEISKNQDKLFKMLNDFYRYNSAKGEASIVLSEDHKNKIDEHSPAKEFFNMEGKGRIALLRNNMNTIIYSIYKFLKPSGITHIKLYKRKGIKKTDKLEEQDLVSVSVEEIETKIKRKDTIFKATYFAKSSY